MTRPPSTPSSIRPPIRRPRDQALISQALYLGGDYAGATALAQKNVDAAAAAGQKPARTDLDVIMAAQVKQKDEAGAEKTLEALVANYNSPDDWKQMMEVSLTTKGMRDIDYVYMGRLMFLQGGQVNAADASLVGSTASRLGFLGEAVQAQKLGGTGFPDNDRQGRGRQEDHGGPDRRRRQAERPLQCEDGRSAVRLWHVSGGQAAAQAAKQKGGVPDASEADMVIGQAQVASGQV